MNNFFIKFILFHIQHNILVLYFLLQISKEEENNIQQQEQEQNKIDNNIATQESQQQENKQELSDQKDEKQNKQKQISKPKKVKSAKALQTQEIIIVGIALINTQIGAAMLTMGYVFKIIGLVLGILSLVIIGLINLYCYYITAKASGAVKVKTMKFIIQSFFGKGYAILTDIAAVCEFSGYLIAYVSTGSDYFRIAMDLFTGKDFKLLYLKIGFGVIVFILSLFTKLDCFNNLGMVSLVVIILSVISVLVYCIKAYINGSFTMNLYDDKTQQSTIVENYPVPNIGNLLWPEQQNSLYAFLMYFVKFPIFMQLYGQFVCQISTYNDLQSQDCRREYIIKKGAEWGQIVTIIIYAVMAISANLLVGRDAASNILLNFPSSDIYMVVVRLLFVFCLIVSYVMMLYSIRSIVMSWFKFPRGSKKWYLTYVLVGACIIIITVILSVLVPNIEVILNFVSALCGSISYQVQMLNLVYAYPEIKAAHIQVELDQMKETKNTEKDEEEIQQKITVRQSLDIIRKSMAIDYNQQVLNEQQQIEVKELQQNIDINRVSIKLDEARKSLQITQVSARQSQINNPNEVIIANETVQNELLQQTTEQINTNEEQQQIQQYDIEKEIKLLEEKEKQLAKMTKCRKASFIIGIIIIAIINIESIVLGTFFDLTKAEPFKK